MKNIQMMMLVFLMNFAACGLYADDAVRHEVPEGMEAISIGDGGGGTLIVPKGAKTRKVGAQIIVEGTKEYMSRMVEELTIRLEKMEQSQKELQEEVETLKKTVEELQAKSGIQVVK